MDCCTNLTCLKGPAQNWEKFTDHGRNVSVNLSQGFADFSCPQYVKEFLSKAVLSDDPLNHQYTRSAGHPDLVKAIAKLYSPLIGRNIDAMSEVLVTVGATGALFCCCSTLLSPGDEVIIIEPLFAFYSVMVHNVGAVPVFVALKPPATDGVMHSSDFTLDLEELASKFNSKTKLIVFNTPNNPLGKVYSREETEMVADLCRRHDVICIADEVYEWITYDGACHIRMASLPGMWERTITICSAGKSFTVTGWRMGWCFGPKEFIKECLNAARSCWGPSPTMSQVAIANCIEHEMNRFGSPECYFTSLSREMATKRDRFASLLKEVGIRPIIPDGGYFLLCDVSEALGFWKGKTDERRGSYEFSSWIAKTKSIAVMPGGLFYGQEHSDMGATYARICFFKKDETLEEFAKLINKWKTEL